MVNTILINSSHVSNSLKNQYTYKFVGGGLELSPNKKHYIALSSITIPYSFFNISDVYGNRSFALICNGTTFNINLPPSFMGVDELNKYIQWFCIQNNLYTLDIDGNYVYYIDLAYNTARYAIEINFYPLVLQSGGSNPGNLLMSGNTMQLVINNQNFGELLGLTLGTYPSVPANVTTSILSNTDVSGSPIQALNITCNIVKNAVSSTPNSFYSFSPSNTQFGSNITLNVPTLLWCNVYSGKHQQITFEIRDQLNRMIEIKDSNVCIMLAIKSDDDL